MADIQQKYFLDYSGLQTLWSKIKNTFANKSEVGTINTNIEALQGNIDNIEAIVLSYAPKIANKYSTAVTIAKLETTAAGTIIIVGQNETINDITYNEGFYIVDTDKSIHYIGTASGTTNNEEILLLRNRISALENQIIKAAKITDSTGKLLGAFTIENNDLIIIYDDEVIADSDSINALTHKAVAAKFKDIENKLTSIPKFKIEVVNELPTNNISFSTIYLVKNNSIESNNLYTEYLYVQDTGKKSHWEILGEQSIALDNYVTKEFLTNTINSALSNYAKTTDVVSLINTIKSEILNTIAENYVTKEYLNSNNILTEEDIIKGIVEGTIGDEIKIPLEQIENLI